MIVDSRLNAGASSWYPLRAGDYTVSGVALPPELLAEARVIAADANIAGNRLLLTHVSSSALTLSAGSTTVTVPITSNSAYQADTAIGFVYLVFGDCADALTGLPDELTELDVEATFTAGVLVIAPTAVARVLVYSEEPMTPAINCGAPSEPWIYAKTAPDIYNLSFSAGLNALLSFEDSEVFFDIQEGAGSLAAGELAEYNNYSSGTASAVSLDLTGCSGAILSFGGALADASGNVNITPRGGAAVTGDAESNSVTIRI